MELELLALLPLLGFVWPWQTVDPESQVPLDTENELVYGPYTPPGWSSGEFGPVDTSGITSSISNAIKSFGRIGQAAATDPTTGKQTNPSTGILSKIKNAVALPGASTASVSSFLSSTMYKVIALVVVVAVIALFGLSYIQAKGEKLGHA